MKLAIVSDMHLGFRQYGLQQRLIDFGECWMWICRKIREEQCDTVLIPGDLFNSRTVDPLSLSYATEGLKLLKKDKIWTVMIKGNHEISRTFGNMDWVDYLVNTSLVTLLDDGVFDPTLNFGKDVLIHGINWQGYNTSNAISQINIRPEMFNILMFHGAIEGQAPRDYPGTLNYEVLRELQFNMIAMGHIHKPYEDGFIFNPGSPETCSISEVEFEDRGISIVTIEKGAITESKKLIPPRRKFFYFKDGQIDCEALTKEGTDAIVFVNAEIDPTDSILEVCKPLYLKISLTGQVDIEQNSPTGVKSIEEMELEAVRNLTNIPAELVLQVRDLTEGREIYDTLS